MNLRVSISHGLTSTKNRYLLKIQALQLPSGTNTGCLYIMNVSGILDLPDWSYSLVLVSFRESLRTLTPLFALVAPMVRHIENRKPWRSKSGKKTRRRIKPATYTGHVVSIDQLISPTPGFVPIHRSASSNRIHVILIMPCLMRIRRSSRPSLLPLHINLSTVRICSYLWSVVFVSFRSSREIK